LDILNTSFTKKERLSCREVCENWKWRTQTK